MSTEIVSVEAEIKKAQDALTKRRNEWKARKHRLQPIVDAMQKHEPQSIDFNDYLWLTIHVSGDKHKLAAIVRILRTRGFKTSEEGPKKGQSYWNPLFYNEHSDTVYLNFSSTVCRRVKVGTKTVEQDVYETVCDELTFERADSGVAA